MKNCPHCGHPLSDFHCDGCNGYGFRWVEDENGYVPETCRNCGGTKRELICTRLSCPGDERLPATGRESAMVRQAMRQVKAG